MENKRIKKGMKMGRNYVKKKIRSRRLTGRERREIRMRYGREQVSNASEQMSSVIPIFFSSL